MSAKNSHNSLLVPMVFRGVIISNVGDKSVTYITVVLDTGWLAVCYYISARKRHCAVRPSRNGWDLLAIVRGCYVLVGVILGQKSLPLYKVGGWPR